MYRWPTPLAHPMERSQQFLCKKMPIDSWATIMAPKSVPHITEVMNHAVVLDHGWWMHHPDLFDHRIGQPRIVPGVGGGVGGVGVGSEAWFRRQTRRSCLIPAFQTTDRLTGVEKHLAKHRKTRLGTCSSMGGMSNSQHDGPDGHGLGIRKCNNLRNTPWQSALMDVTLTWAPVRHDAFVVCWDPCARHRAKWFRSQVSMLHDFR